MGFGLGFFGEATKAEEIKQIEFLYL